MIRSKNIFQQLYAKIKQPLDSRRFRQALQEKTPVFVFQVGKVGSKSIIHSLSHYYDGPLVHAHQFKPDHYFWKTRELYQYYKQGGKMDIITLVREPVSRNISSLFHNFEDQTGAKVLSTESEDLALTDLVQTMTALPSKKRTAVVTWLDRNIKHFFGINVFDYTFPETGWMTYEKNKYRVLLLKAEIKDSDKEKAIAQFLNLPAFKLENTNVGSEKAYADLYNHFKNKARFPKVYLDELIDTPYFRHFYSAEDEQRVRAKWQADD
ncbi:MAG TPA: putative capsular polysaccharide synthesis family protein [Saprospiraceae bacterium]|nr:putative capsular polysaccharide synthesis family protein [Saprospiraceae bacterium]HMQ83736.1 putative capsular polysaccharide synthesis family protein [Saprospiraceae bacterium]